MPFPRAEQDAELRDMSLLEVRLDDAILFFTDRPMFSSKDGTNISMLFDEVVEYIIERREAQEEFRRTQERGYLSDHEEVLD